MTGTLTYRINDEGRMAEYAEGIVWSPGPAAQTVWVLPYTGASQSEAVCVHAPTPKRREWHIVDAPFGMAREYSHRHYRYEERPLTLGEQLARLTTPRRTPGAFDAQVYRQAQRTAPQLPRKTWYAALGIDNVAQLELDTEDVAA
jgi:hypothetical protein